MINDNHLNPVGIAHNGYFVVLVDVGAETSVHYSADNAPCITISLHLNFLGTSKLGDIIIRRTKLLKKKTNTLIFLFCELICNDIIRASESKIWKILKIKPSKLGQDG